LRDRILTSQNCLRSVLTDPTSGRKTKAIRAWDARPSCGASTTKIEELIDELRYTAFMYLGELVEFDETNTVFTSPRDKRTQDYVTGRFG
jgi:hypothetical protein